MTKKLIDKIIKKKNLWEDELYNLGLMSDGDYNNLKTILADLKKKNMDNLQNLSAHLITNPPLTITKRGNIKNFIVKAGTKLDLILNIEGGGGEYTLAWKINNKSPKDAIGQNYPTRIKQRLASIKIPTNDLQTVNDSDIMDSIHSGNKEPIIGSYDWEVIVYDPHTQKSARDKLRLIIIISKEKEKELEDKLNKIMGIKKPGIIGKIKGAGKATGNKVKGGAKQVRNKVIGLLEDEKVEIKLLNVKGKSYASIPKEYRKGDEYLLPLDRYIELVGTKGKLIDKIEWWLCDSNDNEIKKIQERIVSSYILEHKSQSGILNEGYYKIKLKGWEKGKNPKIDQPTNVDTRKVYLKGEPKVYIKFWRGHEPSDVYIKETNSDIITNRHIILDGSVINVSEIPYKWYYKIWLDKDKIEKTIDIIEQNIGNINTKKELNYTKGGPDNGTIYINQEGKFELNIKLNVTDIFGYTEQVIIHRETRILDLSKKREPEKVVEKKKLKEVYDKEIRNLIIGNENEKINGIRDVYKTNNNNLKILVNNLENKQQTYNEEKYKILIFNGIEYIKKNEEDIKTRLNRLDKILEINKKDIKEIYDPLSEFVKENNEASDELIKLINKKFPEFKKLVYIGQTSSELPDAKDIPEKITNPIRLIITFRENTIKILDNLDNLIEKEDIDVLQYMFSKIKGIFKKT